MNVLLHRSGHCNGLDRETDDEKYMYVGKYCYEPYLV